MKLNRPKISLLLIALWLVMATSVASAATIHFRPGCTPKGNIVLLGEVADLLGASPLEAQALAHLELFPAPVTGSQRVRATEIQQAMIRRGVDISRHTFQGSSEVSIMLERTVESSSKRSAPATELEPRVREAVATYLRQRAGEQPWRVSVNSHLEPLEKWGSAPLRVVSGGVAPWTGSHTFLVTCEVEVGTHTSLAHVECRVELPPMFIEATRQVDKGAYLTADDVCLKPGKAGGDQTGLGSIDDVVGKQATRIIRPGQVITSEMLEHPKLVRRGEVVTIYVRRGGILIHSMGRARADGAEGDLVQVDLLQSRESVHAVVTDYSVVQIFATADRVANGSRP